MAEGRLIRGTMFSNEQIVKLEKQGLTGKLLDLHLSYLHIFRLYSLAHGSYDSYMVIFKGRYRTEQRKALPIHHFREFFNTVEQSLKNNTISSIFKLIDEDLKTLSIRTLLIDLHDNIHLVKNTKCVRDILDVCDEMLRNLYKNKDVKELLKYRHNYVSHQNYKMTYEEYSLKNSRFIIGTPRKVLSALQPIFEKLHPIFDSNDVTSSLLYKNSRNEALQILNLLSNFIDRQK